MLDFLISPAYAQAAGAQGPSALFQVATFGVIFVVFGLMIRSQWKRGREQREMLSKLAKGDEAVIAGGLAGRIASIGEAYITLEIADGVNVKVQKSSITSVLPKGTLKNL